MHEISTHAPAGGATLPQEHGRHLFLYFYSRPCGRGDPPTAWRSRGQTHFYSRPCGRGDGRHRGSSNSNETISTHAPAGGATQIEMLYDDVYKVFLLTPLREGRPQLEVLHRFSACHFYSRPCGRGDLHTSCLRILSFSYFYSRPCGRGDGNFPQVRHEVLRQIAER